MKRRNFLTALPLLATAPLVMAQSDSATPNNIAMLNCFKTAEEADKHRMKIRHPQQYGILSMWCNGEMLHGVVENRILRMFV
jgi:hypothetical protein